MSTSLARNLDPPITPIRRDLDTAAFFDAARNGRFLVGWLPELGIHSDPGDTTPGLELVEASGCGNVVSWTVVSQPGPDRAEGRPLVFAVVALDEGPWWFGRLVDVDPADDLADRAVTIAFAPSGSDAEDEVVPVFRPESHGSERPK